MITLTALLCSRLCVLKPLLYSHVLKVPTGLRRGSYGIRWGCYSTSTGTLRDFDRGSYGAPPQIKVIILCVVWSLHRRRFIIAFLL